MLYRFVEWRDQYGNVWSTPSITLLVERPITLTAYYEEVPPPEHDLTINATVGGTTDPLPGLYTHVENSTVQVRGKPENGYNFSHWLLDGITYTSNPINVLMDSDHLLTAYFSVEPPPPPPTYHLTVSTTLGGTTTPEPGIYEYEEGVTVPVTALPETGYHFNHWELDGASRTETPINITMTADHTLLAVFTVTPPKRPPWGWVTFLIGLPIIGGVLYWISKPKK